MDNPQPVPSYMNQSETMEISDVAIFLKAEPETVAQLARNGALPGAKVGKKWIFLKEDVLSFLKQRITEETLIRRQAFESIAPPDRLAPRATISPEALMITQRTRMRRTPLPTLPPLPKIE